MRSITKVSKLLSMIMIVIVPLGAEAAVYSQEITVGNFVVDYGVGDFELPAFDGSLGTATDVTISTIAQLQEYAVVQTKSAYPIPYAGTFKTFFEIDVSGFMSPRYSYIAPAQMITTPLISSGSGFEEVGAGTVSAFFNNSFSIPLTGLYKPSYATIGVFALPIGDLGFASVNSPDVYDKAVVTVSYTYTPCAVPEPFSLALFAVGAMGVVAFAARSNARRAAMPSR